MIDIKNLVKIYPNGTKAVDNISFDVDKGEFFGILGPNGAGKTTLINMMANLIKKTAGSVKINSLEVSDYPQEIYRIIGFAMQEIGLDDLATIREMLYLHGALYHLPKTEIVKRSKELLEMMALSAVADRFVSTYSGGMRRRADLALALIHQPKILFLDEPTTGLDPHARRVIWNHLRQLNKSGMTIVLTTHFMNEAEQLCNRLIIIDAGRIIAAGSPGDLIKKYHVNSLEEVFLKITGHSVEKVSDYNIDPFISRGFR